MSKSNYRANKQRLIIIFVLTIFVFIFAFVVYEVLSLAWFATNTKSEVGGISVGVDSSDIEIISAHAYEVTAIDLVNRTFTFNDIELTKMPTYDPQGVSYHKSEMAAVIAITYRVNSSMSGIKATLRVDDSIHRDDYALINSLSHVALINEGTVSGNVFTKENDDSYYFTSIVGDHLSVDDVTEIDLFTTNPLNYDMGTDYTFYIVLEYNTAVMEHIGDYRLEHVGEVIGGILNTFEESQKEISYVSDLSIVLSEVA